jgi:hypothetical protein
MKWKTGFKICLSSTQPAALRRGAEEAGGEVANEERGAPRRQGCAAARVVGLCTLESI